MISKRILLFAFGIVISIFGSSKSVAVCKHTFGRISSLFGLKNPTMLTASTLLANSLLISAASGSQYSANGISFQYPDGFVVSPKIVKTVS